MTKRTISWILAAISIALSAASLIYMVFVK